MPQEYKNPYHYHLILPVEFSTDFVDTDKLGHNAFDVNLINANFRRWLADHDLFVAGYCEKFILGPNRVSSLPIHIDNPDSLDHVKLNYVFCELPHETIWYQLKPGKELKFAKTFIGTNYAWADVNDCTPVYKASIGTPSLFNAAILHGVPIVSVERITYSMTLARISTDKLLSWSDAEEIFKNYIS